MSNSEHVPGVAAMEMDEVLTAYLDEELSPEERSSVEQRLSEDAEFRARLVALERAWEVLDELPRSVPNHSFTKSTVELAVAEMSRELRRSRPWWSTWLTRAIGYIVVPLLIMIGAYAITYSVRMAPYRQLVQELELIENFEMYDKVNCDLEFVELLESYGFFGGGDGNGPL